MPVAVHIYTNEMSKISRSPNSSVHNVSTIVVEFIRKLAGVIKNCCCRTAITEISLPRASIMRLHMLDLFLRVFVLTNVLGLIFVWSYTHRQESTRIKYEDIITNEMANLQARMSALQQEAEKNYAAIGEMKDAVQGFIEHDSNSHQRLLDILNEAQRELVAKRPPSFRAEQPQQVLGRGAPVLRQSEEELQREVEMSQRDAGLVQSSRERRALDDAARQDELEGQKDYQEKGVANLRFARQPVDDTIINRGAEDDAIVENDLER